MSTLYFGNKGKFDVRAMLTFGVSAKESDDAIGYFGTGFKYAVAIVLRLGGRITVRTGEHVFEFTKSVERIRGKDFDVVKVNGQDAGFTTRLGINWQPWQAFRELWCNCKDEHGEVSPSPVDFETVITVRCDKISQAYEDRDQYILSGTPAFEHSLTRVQARMLEKACASLRRIGVDPSLFPLKVVNGLGDGVMGRALDGTMYLSPLPFNMGTKQVASTIMEEWVHSKHGCEDFDRQMQNWLFDKVLSLAEEISGEPI